MPTGNAQPTVQGVSQGLNDLMNRINTEGITDASGNVLYPPKTQTSSIQGTGNGTGTGTGTGQSNININTGSPINSSYMANPVTQQDIQNLIAQNNANFQKYQQSLQVPQDVQNLQTQLGNLQSQAQNIQLNATAGIKQIQNEPIPLTVSSGLQANIQNQANLQLQTLAAQQNPIVTQLGIASQNWQQNQKSLEAALNYGQQGIQNTLQIQNMVFQQQQALVNQAMAMQQNQRQAWAQMLDTLKYTDPTKYTQQDLDQISQYAQSIGITPQQALQSINTQYLQNQNQQKLQQAQYQYDMAHASYYDQMTGFGGTGNGSGAGGYQVDYSGFLSGLSPDQQKAFQSLNPQTQSDVSQLLQGDALLSDILSSRGIQGSAQRQALLQAARSVDPNFSEANNKQMYEFKTQWNNPNGKSYITRNAINTALGHIATAVGAADDMAKINAGVLTMKGNQFLNFLSKNSGEGPVIQFNYAVNQLASEIATVYKGGVPDQQEINSNKDVLNAALSKGGIHELFSTATELLTSKIGATAREYKNVMGKYPDNPVVDPSLVGQLQQVGVDTSPIQNLLKSQGYSSGGSDIGSGNIGLTNQWKSSSGNTYTLPNGY